MFYRTCPRCGANLDPEEKCTCRQEEERERAEKRREQIDALRADLELDRDQKDLERTSSAIRIFQNRLLHLEEVRAELLRTMKETAKTA